MQPKWGSMNPQQMVEHIVGSWRISNGRAKAPAPPEGEDLARRRDFMFSDAPYPKNLMNPIFANGLPPLRKPDLASALDQLKDEMEAFFGYHEATPNAIEMHPVYGPLDYGAWLHFQYKHMGHHLAQFID